MKIVFILISLLIIASNGEAKFKTPLSEFVEAHGCEILLNPNIPHSFGINDSANHAFVEVPEREKLAKTWEEITSRFVDKFKDEPTLKNYLLFMDPDFSKIPFIETVLKKIAKQSTADLLSVLGNDSSSEVLLKQILSTAAQIEQSVLAMLPQKEVESLNLVTSVALRFDQLQRRNSSEDHFDDLMGDIHPIAPYINSFFTFGAGTEVAPNWNGRSEVGQWIQAPPGFQVSITGSGRTFYQGNKQRAPSNGETLLALPKGIRPTFHHAPRDTEAGYPPRILIFVAIFATGEKK